jgi:hypothetical protein
MRSDDQAIQELLNTVDILRLIAMKGQSEARHFAHYMIAFGLYSAFNIFAELLFGRSFWAPTLYVAFWGATAPLAGILPAGLVWAIAGILAAVIWTLTRSPDWTLGAVLLTAAGGIGAVYTVAARRGRLAGMPPLRVAIAPKIGWAWGILMGGMAVLIAGLSPASLPAGAATALWGYAIGIGLFLSGVLVPLFFPLGLLCAFGVPLLALFAGRPDLAFALEGLMGLAMAVLGLRELRRAAAS